MGKVEGCRAIMELRRTDYGNWIAIFIRGSVEKIIDNKTVINSQINRFSSLFIEFVFSYILIMR